jgi:AcrR family transcriptional regulator
MAGDSDSKAALLAAAHEVLARDRRATVETVAAAAGVSRATVYRLFGSREQLLREVEVEPDPASRDRVLAAAVDLVGRDGLAALSMDELALVAGVSRASLYRLFPGKPALFRELVRTYSPLETVVPLLERLHDRPPEDVMPELARQAARSLEGRTGIVRTLLFEIFGASPDSGEATDYAMARGAGALIGYLVEQMAQGRLRPVHPVIALTSFIGPVLLHLLSRPLLDRALGYDVSVDDTVTELAENWVRSMRPT